MRYQLTLETLKHLDLGKADVAFQRELARVAADCHDRSGDALKRIERAVAELERHARTTS